MKRNPALMIVALLVPTILWTIGPATAQEPATGQEARAESSEPMPDVIWEDLFRPTPVFVAADTLNTPEGVDLSIFPPGFAEGIDLAILSRKPKRGCIRLHSPGELRDDPPKDWGDLRSAVAKSDHVMVVEVTGLRPGFLLNLPGMLVRLRVAEQLKGLVPWETRFLSIPLGEMSIGDKRICMTSDAWAAPPRLGDRLLLLFDAQWNNERSQVLFGVTAPHVIVLPQDDDKALLPRFFAGDPKKSLPLTADLLTEVRRYAGVTP